MYSEKVFCKKNNYKRKCKILNALFNEIVCDIARCAYNN